MLSFTISTASAAILRSPLAIGALLVGLWFSTCAGPLADGAETASFAPVVKQVAPNVVTIFTTKTVKRQPLMLPPGLGDDPQMRRFFGFGERFEDGEHPEKQQGLGSGVVVSAEGYILTNNHVIDGADDIKVGFASGKEQYDAKLIGADAKTDVAVLRIEVGKKLPVVVMGDSDKVEVGDVALAIGNPFGVGQTVTMGIISARGRGVGLADYEDFLQTDASINPGNSGGALVDANGKLIGINTAILSPSGGNLGIGFAVPVNLARSVMDSLISKGKVVRGYLGLMIQPVSPAIAKAFKLANEHGALVGDVVEDGPAAKSGIKAGDVIVAFNDTHIDDPRQLRFLAAQTAPGTKVSLAALRDGKEQKFEVTLQDLAGNAPADAPGPHAHAAGRMKLGVRLAEIDEQNRERFDIPRSVHGALIVEVLPGSRAAEAGIRPGEVIVEVERKPVKSPAEATAAIADASGDIVLRLWSKEGTRFVVVDGKEK